MKLVRKLTAVIILAVCLLLGTEGYVSVRRQLSAFDLDMHQDHLTEGTALSQAVTWAWTYNGLSEALRLIEAANRTEGTVQIRWVWSGLAPGVEGGPVAPAEAFKNLEKEGHAFWRDKKHSPGALYSYFPLLVPGPHKAMLELSESLKSERDFAWTSALHTLIATALIVLGWAIFVGVLGVWFVGRPMGLLVRKARRVGEGDLSNPLNLRRHDELGELAQEMNLMCDRLEAARRKVIEETEERLKIVELLRHADRLSTIGKLASGMAHELGTPLNVISGRAKMLFQGDGNESESRESAKVIVEQADRMTRLIRQLLDFARRRKPERTKIDLNQTVSRTLSVLETLASKQHVTLETRNAQAPVYAEVDPVQIQQVVTNLVMNGIQAMSGGGTLTVEVVPPTPVRRPPPAASEVEAVCIRVRDQGRGIPPEAISHIFEPFFTTKEVGEGSGLGLSVSYGLVEEHGGWFEVHSEMGRGSLFSVYLPVRGVS